MKYITMINSFYPSLSKTEKKVADYIKQVEDQIIYKSLQEVSLEASVGEATVLRFCRRIGYDGFQDMKLSIEQEAIKKTSNEETLITSVTDQLHRAIEDTRLVLHEENLIALVKLLEKANRVYLFGIGASGNAALDLQSRLLRYGKLCHTITDSHYQLMNASIMDTKDLVIVFSLTGYTKEVVDSVKLAKKNGAKIVAITNYILSPLSSQADITILTAGKESPMDGGSLTGKISQLYIIDLICTTYVVRNHDKAKQMNQRIAKSIVNKTLEKK